jgi:putative iron-dependent peroxidase
MFVSFGRSFDAFDAFDAQMHRMVGAENGVTDALFTFARPLTAAGFWCPPVTTGGRLDLRALGA